ncbi:MAG: GntR family transcriptional regulator [Desulfobacterales bacterium]|nr:GntR family transcriptional regulator [Desulfobacterales bacterium]
MVIEKITNVTLRQKVYEQLRTKILGAELLPGEIISLRGLAEKFGVSILPIREAVWQLESENILVVESNKRIQVNHLTSKEFKEVLNLRLLLESEAVDKACKNRPAKAIPKVERILKAMQKHVGVNHKAYIKKNDEFHKTIYTYANSPLLIDLIQRLLARVNPYIYLYAINKRDLSSALGCHHDMLTGFAKGDSKKTIQALHRDLKGAAEWILPQLELEDKKRIG